MTAAWHLGPAVRVTPIAPRRPERLVAEVSPAATANGARALPLALGLSGLWHGGALALALTAGVFQAGAQRDPGPVAEVTLMSAAVFDAMISVAPEAVASPPPAPPPVEGDERAAVGPGGDAVTARQEAGVLQPTEIAEAAPEAMPNPEGPALVADAVLMTEPEPTENEVAPDPAPAVRKKPAPERPQAPQAESAPEAKRAVPEAPSGSGRAASGAGAGETAQASPAAETSLLADWGGSLRRKVERARRSPAGAEGQTGKVTLRLSVAVSGKLLGVAVMRSSGVAALDKAAVDAVRRAGRLPKAPKGLGAASYDFNLPVVFTP